MNDDRRQYPIINPTLFKGEMVGMTKHFYGDESDKRCRLTIMADTDSYCLSVVAADEPSAMKIAENDWRRSD